MYKRAKFTIEGVCPLMLHSGRRLTNPLDPIAKEIKRFTSKRSKSDDDLKTILKLEWIASLYTTEDIEVEIRGNDVNIAGGGKVCMIGEGIEAMLIAAAKKNKLGTTFKSSILTDKDFLIDFPDKNKSIEEIWNTEKYLDVRAVRVQKNAVTRGRPIFKDWSLTFDVLYHPAQVNFEQIQDAVEIAGQVIGCAEYRPRYGRFNLIEASKSE